MQTETDDVGVQQHAVGDDLPYGQEFFDTLKSLGGLTMFTLSMGYSKIQQCKTADRTETVQIIQGKLVTLLSHDDPELEQRAGQSSGAELAEWLYMREKWLRAKLIRLFCGLLILVWIVSFISSLGR